MAKLGNIKCKDIKKCYSCPFYNVHLSVCTSFKLSEPLSKGLPKLKEKTTPAIYEKIKAKLHQEYTGGKNE